MASSDSLVTLAAYPHKLLVLCQTRWGIAPERLCAGTGLQPGGLDKPDRLVPLAAVMALFRRAIASCPADLPLRYGEQLAPATHGLLGLATQTAATLRDVIQLFHDHMAVVMPLFLLHQERRGERECIVIELMPGAPVDEDFVMTMLVSAGWNILHAVLGDAMREVTLHRTSPPPVYADAWRRECPSHLRFNASFDGLSLPARLMAHATPGADAEAHAQVLTRIRERMALLHVQGPFADSVRQWLASRDAHLPRLAEAAGSFGLSPRTFRNRLAREGGSYQQLLDERREALARLALAEPDTTIKAVALRLGYENSSNFSRVFKRWTGVSPMRWRQARQRG